MGKRIFFLSFGLVCLTASIREFIDIANIVNFFSLFTYLSNTLITLFFLYFGITNKKEYAQLTVLKFGAIVVYMIVTGIGYWVFLRDVPVPIPWANMIVHGIMPVAAPIGWFILSKNMKLSYMTAFYYLVFPIVFLIYSLFRGALTGWYPYDFLNPMKVNGYSGVLVYVGIFSAIVFVVSLIILWIGNTFNNSAKK